MSQRNSPKSRFFKLADSLTMNRSLSPASSPKTSPRGQKDKKPSKFGLTSSSHNLPTLERAPSPVRKTGSSISVVSKLPRPTVSISSPIEAPRQNPPAFSSSSAPSSPKSPSLVQAIGSMFVRKGSSSKLPKLPKQPDFEETDLPELSVAAGFIIVFHFSNCCCCLVCFQNSMLKPMQRTG